MTIDTIIVLFYLILVLVLGLYNKSSLPSFKNYARVSGATKTSKILLTATLFVSSVGGATTFGIAEKAFSGDVSYTYGLLLALPIDILIAIYIIPRIITHYGAQSVGDIMAKYYGGAGRFIAGISTVIVSIGFVAAQISVSGYIFQYILKISYIEGVVLSYGIVIIYTTIGGLQSIMFTNLLQFFAMIIAIPLITICGVNKIGFGEFISTLPVEKIYASSDLLTNTIIAALGFLVMNLYPTFIQRTLINKNPSETSKAFYVKTAIYVLFLIFVTLNGLITYNLYPDQPSNLALPYLIDQIVPTGLQGVVVVGLLAAVMSTADSDLNVTSIALVKDIFNPIFKVKNQIKLLWMARVANVFIGSFAIIIALCFNNVIDLVVFITGFWGPIILVPLVMALFNIVISQRKMIICSAGGASSFLIWQYFFASYIPLKGVFVGTIVSLVAFSIALAMPTTPDKA